MLPPRRNLNFDVMPDDNGCVFVDGGECVIPAELISLVQLVQTEYPGCRLIYCDAKTAWTEIAITPDNTIGFFPYFGQCPELLTAKTSQ